jgi:hypothetical protein
MVRAARTIDLDEGHWRERIAQLPGRAKGVSEPRFVTWPLVENAHVLTDRQPDPRPLQYWLPHATGSARAVINVTSL